MKTLLIFLFLSLSIFAENMSLGPFNKPGFVTQEELLRTKQEAERLKRKRAEEELELFNKHQAAIMAENNEKKRKEQAQRLRQQQEAKRRKQAQLLKQKKIKDQIAANLLQARQEKERKRRFNEALESAQESEPQQIQELQEGPIVELTPMQENLHLSNPDDIKSELANTSRLRYILLHSPDTPEAVKEYIRFLNTLSREYDLDFAFSYTGVMQSELASSTQGGGGKYDMLMSYTPTESTQFALKTEGLHQIGSYSSTSFKNEIGALSSTSAPYGTTSLFLSELWLQQTFSSLIVRAGKIDPSSFFDSYLYKSNSRFFFSSTFSNDPYNAYPATGLGLATRYVQDNYYISAEATDANAVIDELDNAFLSEKEYYTALEFGVTPKDGSKYHLTTWHKDKASIAKTKEAKGIIASIVQAMDKDVHLIIRGAVSDNASAKRYASLGLGKTSLFIEHDISGLAIGTLVPSKDADKTQTTLETFYRIDPIPGVQISADLQFIYHPSRADQVWAVLPGMRLRLLF